MGKEFIGRDKMSILYSAPNILLEMHSLFLIWCFVLGSVDGRNPKQPPGMVLKPCK